MHATLRFSRSRSSRPRWTDWRSNSAPRCRDSRDGSRAARDALREARAELTEMVGPALPDGRHFVRIAAVGDDQDRRG